MGVFFVVPSRHGFREISLFIGSSSLRIDRRGVGCAPKLPIDEGRW